MRPIVLAAAVLGSAVFAHPGQEKRQIHQATNPAQFSSAAEQLISLYIPQSVAVPLGVAIQSAASTAGVTGDINSIVQSALTAATPPAFLSAVPTQYKPNIVSLESAISALRGTPSPTAKVFTITSGGSTFASTSSASLVLNTTNSAGSTYITTVPPPSAKANQTVVTTTDSSGSTITSTLSGGTGGVVVITTVESGKTITTTSTSATSASSGSAAATSTSSAASAQATTTAKSTSKSKGFAAPTQIPVAAAGVIGLIGMALAL